MTSLNLQDGSRRKFKQTDVLQVTAGELGATYLQQLLWAERQDIFSSNPPPQPDFKDFKVTLQEALGEGATSRVFLGDALKTGKTSKVHLTA